MTKRGSRTGSALLIVLGMMAFMLVSAVAFSAYMRYSRLPSSYLRRTSASRQLAKAAVARAVDSLDRAICNNPHPGLGSQSIGGPNRNIWNQRVYMATNTLLEIGDTAPVLTLEALAYIPPPLVNVARYYSRRSAAAQWQSFGFDVGRYAFCALDVSDYFDVNRMVADTARSSMPQRRISLSYLFEGVNHGSAATGADAWDTFMDKFRDVDDDTLEIKFGSKVPVVSVADLNLAMGEGTYGGLRSPFCRYLKSSGGQGFYNTSNEDDEERIRRMTFVTDGWFPVRDDQKTDADGKALTTYDLTRDGQPFSAADLGSGPKGGATLRGAFNPTTAAGKFLKQRISDIGMAALFDYLDEDSIPVSLALPTVERAPMICGIRPNLNASFKLVLDADKAAKATDKDGTLLNQRQNQGPTRDAYAWFEYSIDPGFAMELSKLKVDVLTLYPFCRQDDVGASSFTLDGRATFFLNLAGDDPANSDNRIQLRTNNDNDKIHIPNEGSMTATGMDGPNGIITVPLQQRPLAVNAATIEKERDAIQNCSLVAKRISGAEFAGHKVARIRYKWTQKWNDDAGQYEPQTCPDDAEPFEANCDFNPLDKSGGLAEGFSDATKFLERVRKGQAVELNMALVLRIVDKQNKTVDLVPAHIFDDEVFNKINNRSVEPKSRVMAGFPYPVMPFTTGIRFNYKASEMKKAVSDQQTSVIQPSSVYVDDPRHNFAPESWYVNSGEDFSEDDWLANCGRDEADGDIFMATSDQGYLQSIYELSFLPRVSNLVSIDGRMGYMDMPAGRASFATQAKDALNFDLMWSTYSPFGDDADDFEGLNFTSSGNGYKINPYSDSTNVIMAALANTPLNWRCASTNNVLRFEEMESSKFNTKYAWNGYSSGGCLEWADLERVASRFIDAIRNTKGTPDWRDVWDDLGWLSTKDNEFLGVSMSKGSSDQLWSADRKFLYGFWRDCFEAKQQLFLVFVRAEPMMMGGGMVGQIPPQLGARAVALVWRDPRQTLVTSQTGDGSGQGYPHQTRILFYRQLE